MFVLSKVVAVQKPTSISMLLHSFKTDCSALFTDEAGGANRMPSPFQPGTGINATTTDIEQRILSHSGEFARLRDSLKPIRSLPTAPKILFVLAPDHARHIESPGVNSFSEAQRRKGNLDLDRVTVRVDASRRYPRSIP